MSGKSETSEFVKRARHALVHREGPYQVPCRVVVKRSARVGRSTVLPAWPLLDKMVAVWLRYVAIGDSTVEGLEDPAPNGSYVGWADRLALHLVGVHPGLMYANLAVRGQTAHQVRTTQLDRALDLRPDIAVVVAGVNDILRPRFDADALRGDVLAMHAALHDTGARVLAFSMPDMARVAPVAVVLRGRLQALNRIVYEARDRYGSTVVDLAAEPVAADPALWHDDRLHANSEGHRRIAAALAESLGIDAGEWRDLPAQMPRDKVATIVSRELAWAATHLIPWVWGHLPGRRSEAEAVCKRPELAPVELTRHQMG